MVKSVVVTLGLALALFMVLLATVPTLADSDGDGDRGKTITCSVAFCHGHDDNDTLYGTTGNERIRGGPGPDKLYAGSDLPETVQGNGAATKST